MQLPQRLRHLSSIVKPKNRVVSTSVYVLQCNEFIKVGIAGDVVARVAELQVGNPHPIRILGHWIATDAIREEEIIHSHLERYRERGEWFRLPKQMMDTIAMKLPGYELAQRIMPQASFALLRLELWRLNASAYHSKK